MSGAARRGADIRRGALQPRPGVWRQAARRTAAARPSIALPTSSIAASSRRPVSGAETAVIGAARLSGSGSGAGTAASDAALRNATLPVQSTEATDFRTNPDRFFTAPQSPSRSTSEPWFNKGATPNAAIPPVAGRRAVPMGSTREKRFSELPFSSALQL
jgi:hypothetical protein